jgi:glyoxylase-like metal-dependent hydrolase (beta-lactamase superfamily II)
MASATYKAFCGGIFETNCYLFETPEGWILFDAPEGACEWVRSLNIHPKLLLLTHGHVDHVQDVARVKRQFHSQIGCHPLTAPMISDRDFFRNFGFALEIEPVEPDFLIEEIPNRSFLGSDFLDIAQAVFVSFRPRTGCSLVATFFSPAALDAVICLAEIWIS